MSKPFCECEAQFCPHRAAGCSNPPVGKADVMTFHMNLCNDCFKRHSEFSPGDVQWLKLGIHASVKMASDLLYHVTTVDRISKILSQGILPMQTSNWIKGKGGERYGEGEVYACDNPNDAVRWAFKTEWEHKTKTAIITFVRGDLKWEVDSNDPLSQAANKGHWLKAIGKVPVENFRKVTPLTQELTRAVVEGKEVKLAMITSDAELANNSHPANNDGQAGAPVLDGELEAPERANVNAMREAIETQKEMEVGKPVEEKQDEVKTEEKADAQGISVEKGSGGTQIIINIAGKKKEMTFSNLATAKAFIKDASAKFGSKFAVLSRPDQCPECGSIDNYTAFKDGKRYNPFERGQGLWDTNKCNECGKTWPFRIVHMVENHPATSGMSDIDGGAPSFKGAASKTAKNCTVCGKPVELVPSAVERAKRHGGNPSDYTNLFDTHPECAIEKRNRDTSDLMRRKREEAEANKVVLKGASSSAEELEELGKDIAEQGRLEEFHQKNNNHTMYDYHKARRLELQGKYNAMKNAGHSEWVPAVGNPGNHMHYELSYDEALKYPGNVGVPDPKDFAKYPWMLCRNGSAHAARTRNRKRVTCPECLRRLEIATGKTAAGWPQEELDKGQKFWEGQGELARRDGDKVYMTNNPEEPGIHKDFYDRYFQQNYPALWDAWQVVGTHDPKELREIVNNQGLSINPETADKVRAAKYILDWHKGRNGGKFAPKASYKKEGSMKKYKVYTGPTLVKDVAEKLRKAGIQVNIEGTEHVHFQTDKPREEVLRVLRAPYQAEDGAAVGWSDRDISEMPSHTAGGMNFSPSNVPSQVLQEFYPELQHELIEYPNVNNSPMITPEITGDAHELGTAPAEGIGEATLITNNEEPELLPGALEDAFDKLTVVSYVSTSPAAGAGIGRDGKPQVLEGAPLGVNERQPYGVGQMDSFYQNYQEVPGAALKVISKKVATAEEKTQFSLFLKKVMGEVAASFIAAFKVTTRMPMNKVPGVGEIQLAQIEQATNISTFNIVNTGSRVKYLMDKLTDSEIQDAINDAYAQGAVWHEGKEGGFVYEVFVRAETIDTDSMILKYKFVTGTKEAGDVEE